VLEIAKGSLVAAFLEGDFTGALIKVDAQGNKTEIASEGLTAPGGVAINAAGEIYVTNNSIFPGAGQVLKIK
jgi:DNA-binding beta-propeller fold protein YncE